MDRGGAITFFALIALVIVGFGAVTLFLPDVDWSWTKFGNDLRGVRSERSEGYEAGRILRGILTIGIGLCIGVVGVGWAASLERQSVGTRNFLTATVATPTAVARAATALAAANAPLPMPEPEIYVVVDTDDPGGGLRLAPAANPAQRIEKRFFPIGLASVNCSPNEVFDAVAAAAPIKDRTRELLLGQRVRIAYDPLIPAAHDDDTRWIYLWILSDSTLFNRRMIAEGYYLANASVSTTAFYETPYRYQGDFEAAEAEARAERRGVWGNPACGLSLGTRVAARNTPTPYVYITPTPRILPTSRPDATP